MDKRHLAKDFQGDPTEHVSLSNMLGPNPWNIGAPKSIEVRDGLAALNNCDCKCNNCNNRIVGIVITIVANVIIVIMVSCLPGLT